MFEQDLYVIILAAGNGLRMQSNLPKALHPVGSVPIVNHVVNCVTSLQPKKIVVVVGSEMPDVQDAVFPHATVIQTERKGTGHAVMCAMESLPQDAHGTLLVLYSDVPLIARETLKKLFESISHDTAVGVLGFEAHDPTGYGRIVTSHNGVSAIVEHKDADEETRRLTLCHSGIMALDMGVTPQLLARLDAHNAASEYYLTQVVDIAVQDQLSVVCVHARESEVMGVNTRAQLAAVEAVFQQRKRQEVMASGVTLVAPETVFFSYDTRVGRDVMIEPHVVFGRGVVIEDNVKICSFSHLEGAHIGQGAQVGPFARLRPGATLGEDAKVGNFVEIKNATLGEGAKVNHLSYVGDARVGERANVGAGVITCNYNGFKKSVTEIGSGAFVGSNVSLVAPVTIGDGAIVAAGSCVTRSVASDSLAIERGETREKPGWAARFRNTQKTSS